MSESRVPSALKLGLVGALIVMAMTAVGIFQPQAIPFDHEELYNAAHARLLQDGHWSSLLSLQYRGYCGGCTQHAILGAGLFSLLGPSLFAWKLIPVLYAGVMGYAGFRLLLQYGSAASAWTWIGLLSLPAPTFAELSLTAWGNHYEAGVAGVVFLWVVARLREAPSSGRALATGLTLAWALWIGYSAVFLVVTAAVLLWRRISRTSAAWLATGVLPLVSIWAIQHFGPASSPFETIYYTGESLPRLSRVPEKLASLLAPRQLIALYGDRDLSVLGLLSAASVGVSILLCRRTPAGILGATALGAFLTVYCSVRFTVWAPPSPEIASPGSMRYAAPFLCLTILLLSAAAGSLYTSRRHFLGTALIAPIVLTGALTKGKLLNEHFPDTSVFEMGAADFDFARDQAGYTLSASDHADCTAADADLRAFHDYGRAWHQARAVLDADSSADITHSGLSTRAALEGLAAALLAEVDPAEAVSREAIDALYGRLGALTVDQQLRVVSAAARRRGWVRPYVDGGGPVDLVQFQASLAGQPEVVARALTEALGRYWAEAVFRHRERRTIELPSLSPLHHQTDFIAGTSEVIGERFGPDVAPPADLPARFSARWRDGIMTGSSQTWLNRPH